MTVLWILLGVLAALLLLLCCPVTLRLSWWPAAASKRDEPSGCLTEQVERDLEQLGLAPEDEQQLRRLIQGLPDPPPQQPQKELRLTLHYLFLRLTLYPQKPKPPKEPKQPARKKKSQREKQVEEKKEKLDTAAILRMIPEIVNCAKKPLEIALGDLCLHHLQLYAMVARPDSAQAALDTQKFVSAVYTALAAAQNWIRVRHADIRLRPDFSGSEESSWAVRLRLSFHPIVMLAAALRSAFCLLRLLLAQKKKEQPEEQKKQTA